VRPAQEAAASGLPSPSASLVRSTARHAYCPLCGQAREIPASALRVAEDALCPGRCLTAWQALAALRLRESMSDRITLRRQSEYESGQAHAPALSDLLLRRWRGGDWTVAPELLLMQVSERHEPHEGPPCESA
jgi:hypothetical protein